MRKTFFFLTLTAVLLSACTKNETCTCKLGNTVTFTESTSDSQKVESDCESYAQKANAGATVITVCTVQ
jgi:hypothetical protein